MTQNARNVGKLRQATFEGDDQDFDLLEEHPGDGPGEGQDVPSRTMITFHLSDQTFGADVRFVREIVDVKKITPMPGAPGDVLGLIDLRNESIAIIDLAGRFGLPGAEGEDARIIVLTFHGNGKEHSLGIVADNRKGVNTH